MLDRACTTKSVARNAVAAFGESAARALVRQRVDGIGSRQMRRLRHA